MAIVFKVLELALFNAEVALAGTRRILSATNWKVFLSIAHVTRCLVIHRIGGMPQGEFSTKFPFSGNVRAFRTFPNTELSFCCQNLPFAVNGGSLFHPILTGFS